MSEILEDGDLFFFYRPRVGTERVEGLDDVQRFFLIMRPDGTDRYRLVTVGRKRLPDPRTHEREWAFVARVGGPEQLQEELERRAYETRTRGERLEPEARPVGEARYAIVDHDGHTHLAYVLELPSPPGEAQRQFRIEHQASYVVAVRNPSAPAPPGAGLDERQRAAFPPELLERFRGRRFISVDPPDFLDYEGAELVLIGASEQVVDELGIELDAEAERIETADVFAKLRLRPGEVPIDPLERGELR
jgi:hypothetical protein